MKVLKKTDILTLVAEEIELPEQVVKQVIDLYWEEVITSVRTLKHINIFIPQIGELRIAKSKIGPYYEKLCNRRKFNIDPNLEEKIKHLEAIMELRDKEYKKRDRVRKKRETYDKTKESVEGEVEDPGGSVV